MHRAPLLALLRNHRPSTTVESNMLNELISFVETHSDCFERSLSIGHITASAWIVDTSRTYALLTHHRKLDSWLQLGGHADGVTDVLQVALTEANEEAGLSSIRPVQSTIFDVDIHLIPGRHGSGGHGRAGWEAPHYHYDIRFLLEADKNETLVRAERESKALEWVALTQISLLNNSESIIRMVEKTLQLQ